MVLTLTHYEKNLNRTPALILVTEGWLEIQKNGHGDGICNVYWDDSAVLASIGDEPVGVISYRVQEWAKRIELANGYVRQEYRRQGIYRKLWDALVEKAVEKKLLTVVGGTHIKNLAMQPTMLALGRPVTGLLYEFTLPPATEV